MASETVVSTEAPSTEVNPNTVDNGIQKNSKDDHVYDHPLPPHPSKPSFACLLKDNRIPNEDAMLDSIPIDEEKFKLGYHEINTVEEALGFFLFGCVLGNKPNAYIIRNFLKGWDSNIKFRIHGSGWITFTFNTEEERDKVLNGGPYMILGRQLYLKLLPHCFLYREEDMAFLPTWVQIHGFPADCWTKIALSRLASVLGTPMQMDKVTLMKGNTNFARVLIEIDATKPRLYKFDINLPTDEQVTIRFIYEGGLKFCEVCNKLGHASTNCPVLAHKNKVKEKLEEEDEGDRVTLLDDDSDGPLSITEADVMQGEASGSKKKHRKKKKN